MEQIAWAPHMAVGIPSVDLAHQALIGQIAHLLAQPDEAFGAGLALLVDCLEQDFRAEEALMEAIGYPGLPAHREQHARVLATLHGLHPDDVAAARHAVSLLPLWFEAHLATMDTVLAIAVQLASTPSS
ncbi:bacteriohemerythrin [Pseudoduganella aquatica]|uniref:Bacteriohemerythrin n=1 Tax=Pseudoduganella aquatica TaxID=2660641 RepID=A0A7X4HJ99_9BURK|nr:hemerythrin family protein [Pseudoduganella aquatica]MYN11195.1 hypothetical protein [Pseudoduganella aquatica]